MRACWWAAGEAAGLAWPVGMGAATATYFTLYLGGRGGAAAGWAAGAAGVAAAGVIGWGVWTARGQRHAVDGRGGRGALAAGLGIAAAQVALAVWMTARAPFAGEDSWAFWGLKARMFSGGGLPPGYFHDAAFLYTHPDYPLSVPLAEGLLYRWQGSLREFVPALVGPACLAALLVLFAVGLRRLYGRLTAGLGTAALALIPAVPAGAAVGAADLPLAMYAGLAALYLRLWWQGQQRLDAVVMGLCAGGAAWTKKEGAAVAAVLLLAYAAGELGRRGGGARSRAARLASGLLPALLFPLPWEVLLHTAHPGGRDFLPLTVGEFAAHANRLGGIVGEFVAQMLALGHWSLLWGVLAALVVLGWRRLGAAGYGLLAVLVGQLGVYACSYVFSSWGSYLVHIWTSLDRLLLQATPLAVLLLVEALAATAGRAEEVRAGAQSARNAPV